MRQTKRNQHKGIYFLLIIHTVKDDVRPAHSRFMKSSKAPVTSEPLAAPNTYMLTLTMPWTSVRKVP